MMALPVTLVVGVLMLPGVQASDIADGSKSHVFLSKYMPLRSGYSKSSIGDTGKFMAHHLKHMEHEGRPEASSDHNDLAEEAPIMPTVDSPFLIYSDTPAHPSAPTQHTLEVTLAQAGAFRISKELEPQKITEKDEHKDVQKLFTNASNMPVGLSAIGVGLLSCAAMVGVRMWRGMQPFIALASSGGHGIDMSIPLVPVSVDKTLDLESQGSCMRIPEQVLQGSERVLAKDTHARIKRPCALGDPFGLGKAAPESHVEIFRQRELHHGRAAVTAVFFVSLVSTQKPRPMHTLVLAHEGERRVRADDGPAQARLRRMRQRLRRILRGRRRPRGRLGRDSAPLLGAAHEKPIKNTQQDNEIHDIIADADEKLDKVDSVAAVVPLSKSGRGSVGGGKKWVRLNDLMTPSLRPSYSEMSSSISMPTPSLSSYASPPASSAATGYAPVEVASGCSATCVTTRKECSRLTNSRCRPECVAAGAVHNELLPESYVTRIPQADQQILNCLLAFLEAACLENVPLFITGGYVRDLLLGKEPNDLDLSICLRHCAEDVTVAGLLEKVTAFLASRIDLGITEVKVATILSNESKKKNLDTFKAFFSDKAGHKIEVDIMPTIGEETYEEGSRTPVRDTRGAPEQDALRRDLTVGAIFLQVERAHLAQGSQLSYRLLDFYGGVSDLRTGVLRAPYPVSRSAQEVADEVLRSPEERDLAAQLGLSRRTDKEALQKLWWAKILMDDPLRACRALVYCSKLSGFELHETFWDAMPFALQALHSKVAGSRKNTEYQKIGDYGFQACMEFYELAFTRTFGPGPAPSLRLASALFGGQDDNGVAKTLSEVTEFDLEAFRDIAEAMKPEEGCSGPEAAELMGGLLAAAVSASEGLRGTALEEFSQACDGMCVSNSMRKAGSAPLYVASKWLADFLQPNALDVGFAAACSTTPENMHLYSQVWQDFQLPGTDKAPAWSTSKRRLALSLSTYFASECHKERLAGLKAATQIVSCARPPVKGTVLSSPGLLEVPPKLRRQVLSLLEVSLRMLDHKACLETPQELQEFFETFPLVQAALSPTVLAELTPRKPAKKAKDGKETKKEEPHLKG